MMHLKEEEDDIDLPAFDIGMTSKDSCVDVVSFTTIHEQIYSFKLFMIASMQWSLLLTFSLATFSSGGTGLRL